MSVTGLSATAQEYRERLAEQPDDRIDAWVAELMRDTSIRHGVLAVLADFRQASAIDDEGLERLYAAGGGPPAAVGRTADGRLMVPATSLHYFASGSRRLLPDARSKLIDYLVNAFHEIVFI
jgi:hypothetical protein